MCPPTIACSVVSSSSAVEMTPPLAPSPNRLRSSVTLTSDPSTVLVPYPRSDVGADIGDPVRQVVAQDAHAPCSVWAQSTGQDPHCRRLPSTVRAQQPEHPAGFEGEIHPVEHHRAPGRPARGPAPRWPGRYPVPWPLMSCLRTPHARQVRPRGRRSGPYVPPSARIGPAPEAAGGSPATSSLSSSGIAPSRPEPLAPPHNRLVAPLPRSPGTAGPEWGRLGAVAGGRQWATGLR